MPSEVRILPCPLSIGHCNLQYSMKRGSNSVGRVTAFQAVGRGFESRLPLHKKAIEGAGKESQPSKSRSDETCGASFKSERGSTIRQSLPFAFAQGREPNRDCWSRVRVPSPAPKH